MWSNIYWHFIVTKAINSSWHSWQLLHHFDRFWCHKKPVFQNKNSNKIRSHNIVINSVIDLIYLILRYSSFTFSFLFLMKLLDEFWSFFINYPSYHHQLLNNQMKILIEWRIRKWRIIEGQSVLASSFRLRHRAFNNYVDTILPFFAPPPPARTDFIP